MSEASGVKLVNRGVRFAFSVRRALFQTFPELRHADDIDLRRQLALCAAYAVSNCQEKPTAADYEAYLVLPYGDALVDLARWLAGELVESAFLYRDDIEDEYAARLAVLMDIRSGMLQPRDQWLVDAALAPGDMTPEQLVGLA